MNGVEKKFQKYTTGLFGRTIDTAEIPDCGHTNNQYDTKRHSLNISDFGFTSNTAFIAYMRSHPDELLTVKCQEYQNREGSTYKEVRLAKMDITVKPKN